MESWAIFYLIFYLALVSLVIFWVSNSDYKIFDLTDDQVAVMQNPSNDAGTLLNKLLTLSSVSSAYGIVTALMGILTIIFIVTIALIINEFVPLT